jgi:hypothetical protein
MAQLLRGRYDSVPLCFQCYLSPLAFTSLSLRFPLYPSVNFWALFLVIFHSHDFYFTPGMYYVSHVFFVAIL